MKHENVNFVLFVVFVVFGAMAVLAVMVLGKAALRTYTDSMAPEFRSKSFIENVEHQLVIPEGQLHQNLDTGDLYRLEEGEWQRLCPCEGEK